MRLDRGPSFGGYCTTNPATPTVVYGQSYENAFPCGTFLSGGVLKGLTFFIFLKDVDDILPDNPSRNHAEVWDIPPDCADKTGKKEIIDKLLHDADVTTAVQALKPIPKYLVDKDIKEGKKGDQIVRERVGILTDEWLGFTLAEVMASYPEIWQPTTVDGVEVANVWKCSLEEI
jgi:hypothetical protein